ncbi:MAG: hypothetical protein ACJAZN_002733 [Planctomycetota bacterium]
MSSIHGCLTTVKLLSVGPTGIELERVEEVVSDEHGQPVNPEFYYLRLAGVAVFGLALLVTLRRFLSPDADSDPSPAEANWPMLHGPVLDVTLAVEGAVFLAEALAFRGVLGWKLHWAIPIALIGNAVGTVCREVMGV